MLRWVVLQLLLAQDWVCWKLGVPSHRGALEDEKARFQESQRIVHKQDTLVRIVDRVEPSRDLNFRWEPHPYTIVFAAGQRRVFLRVIQ